MGMSEPLHLMQRPRTKAAYAWLQEHDPEGFILAKKVWHSVKQFPWAQAIIQWMPPESLDTGLVSAWLAVREAGGDYKRACSILREDLVAGAGRPQLSRKNHQEVWFFEVPGGDEQEWSRVLGATSDSPSGFILHVAQEFAARQAAEHERDVIDDARAVTIQTVRSVMETLPDQLQQFAGHMLEMPARQAAVAAGGRPEQAAEWKRKLARRMKKAGLHAGR